MSNAQGWPGELPARRAALLSEVQKRQAAISAAEAEVGRAVWAEARNGVQPPPGAEAHVAAAEAAAAQIAALHNQMASAQAEAAAKAAARAAAADTSTHCPACRAPRVAGERYCSRCGQPMLFGTPAGGGGPTASSHRFVAPAPLPAVPAVATAEAVAVPVAPCDRCGEDVSNGQSFCPRCGWRVAPSALRWWRSRWLRVLVAGFVLYVFCQAILPNTNYNPGFIAAELVIGSLLVPITFVTYFYERGTRRQTPMDVLVITFVLGAVLGCSAAAILEGAISWNGYWQYVPVGFIEEGAKGVILIWWLRRTDLLSPDKGFVIGAATGMGFAVLETMGTYALNNLLTALVNGAANPVTAMVSELNVRGVLAPLGHGTWTGILAGVMWYERSVGRSPFGRRVVITYVAVSLLHALYDISVSSHVLLISFVSNSKVSFFGIVFGLVGLATLMVMVRLVRHGRDPVSTLVAHVQQVQGAVSGTPGAK